MKRPALAVRPGPPMFDRVLVLAFRDGQYARVPVSDGTVIRVGGSSFSMEECVNVLLVDTDDSLLDSITDAS